MYSYLLQIKSCFKIIDRAAPITIRVVQKMSEHKQANAHLMVTKDAFFLLF